MTNRTHQPEHSPEAPVDRSPPLQAALDRLAVGFAVFDADLGLAAWNAPFASLAGHPRTLLVAGTPIESLLPGASAADDSDTGAGVPVRIRRVRERIASEPEIVLASGTCLQIRCDTLPGGGAVLSCIDNTVYRKTLQALKQSDERYSLVAEAAEEGLYDWRIVDDEIYVSPRLCRLFGHEADELGPKDWNWNSRIHPDDLQTYLCALEAHFSGDTPTWRCEYRFRDKDGSYRWILDHGYTVRNEGGRPVRLVGAIRDVSRRKQVEDALRESEARYELAMRAINEGVYDWNIADDSIYYSDRVYTVLGLSRDELTTPRDWYDRVHPDDLAGYREALIAHFRGETDRFEHTFRYRDGQNRWRWALQHGVALMDENGRACRMIGSTGDVTELKENERELAQKTRILETTLENIDQGISMVDRDLRTIALNSRFLEILELPPEKFASGFHMEEAFRYNAERGEYGPGDVEDQVRSRLELARRFEAHSFERERPDGTVIAIRGRPLPGGGFVTTYTDVTEQKRTEAALRENEERYALASRAATEGVYDWNITTGSLYLTERSRSLFALPDEPLTPQAWNTRVHPDDYQGYREALIAYFKGEAPGLEHEYRIRDATGGYIWVLDRGIAVRDESGRVTRLVGAVRNITARKEAELELRRARDQAEAATRAKSTFLANMSHELRTPLNAIIGFTRIVSRKAGDRLDATQSGNLQKILVSAEHLLALINTVLDLSKIEADRLEVNREPLEPGPLLEQCLRTIEPLVDRNRVTLTLDVPPGLPVLDTDGEKVRQILINLLGNAVKFTETGTIRLGVQRCLADRIDITVSDTGIGIPEDRIEAIFEEFAQVDTSTTRQHGGTGLGLSIARRLARLLGGDLSASSAQGAGSEFVLTLPVSGPARAESDQPHRPTEPAA